MFLLSEFRQWPKPTDANQITKEDSVASKRLRDAGRDRQGRGVFNARSLGVSNIDLLAIKTIRDAAVASISRSDQVVFGLAPTIQFTPFRVNRQANAGST